MTKPGTGKPLRRHPHHRGLFSLRFQIVSILLLCYIIPTVVLGIFARHILLGSVQKNVESALVSNAKYAWNTTVQNLDRIVALGQEAVYDEELANASQLYMAEQYQAEAKQWGVFDADRWNRFYDFINEKKLAGPPRKQKRLSKHLKGQHRLLQRLPRRKAASQQKTGKPVKVSAP